MCNLRHVVFLKKIRQQINQNILFCWPEVSCTTAELLEPQGSKIHYTSTSNSIIRLKILGGVRNH
jgi:hypothetical protein